MFPPLGPLPKSKKKKTKRGKPRKRLIPFTCGRLFVKSFVWLPLSAKWQIFCSSSAEQS